MIPPFDVFSTTNNGPEWIGAAESLVQALQIARKKGTGSYFVFSLQTGCKTMYEVDAVGSGNCGRPIPEILADSAPLAKPSSS
jgi:hypothetical protein